MDEDFLPRRGAARRICRAALLRHLRGPLLTAGGVLLAVLVLILGVVGPGYHLLKEERGTSGQFSLDWHHDNPTVRGEDGLLHAAALTEPQALIDAYYKYLSLDSFRKVVDGRLYRFSDPDQTEDFAALGDYFHREDSFYLSSHFIRMADELLHGGRFFYPEQVIRPVCWKTGPEGRVEAVPVFDRDSGQLLPRSRPWGEDGLSQRDTPEPGVWDWGLGSVLQYDAFRKDRYLRCRCRAIQVDLHRFSWQQGEDGSWQRVETCLGVQTVDIPDGATPAQVQQALHALESPPTPEGGGDWTALVGAPTPAQIASFLEEEPIPMALEGEDQLLASTDFGPGLEKFSNRDGGGVYPLTIPLLTAAATLSGSISYFYEGTEETTAPLSPGSSRNPADPVTDVVYGEGCPQAGTLAAIRTGEVHTLLPRCREETAPWGFDYLEAYCRDYVCYVPQGVLEDLDFSRRLEDNPGIVELMTKLGLLQPLETAAPGQGPLPEGGGEADWDDVTLLAKLISREAGSNKLDELMVGAVCVNRWKTGQYGDTLLDAIAWPNAYSTWKSGAIRTAVPSRRDYESARECLTGAFAIPSNIIGQALFVQGPVWMTTDNRAGGGGTQYYCWSRYQDLSPVDWLGRPAPTPDQARALAASLDRGEGEGEYALQPGPPGPGESIAPEQLLFIGNSLVEGLQAAAGGRHAFLCENGLRLSGVPGKIYPRLGDQNFRTALVELGTNELPDCTKEAFQAGCRALAGEIREANPAASIVFLSIPPVSAARSAAGDGFTNERVRQFNGWLREICTQGVVFLDCTAFFGEELDPAMTDSGGIHLTPQGYRDWYAWILEALPAGGGTTGSAGGGTLPGADLVTTDSPYRLYRVQNFDVLTALSALRAITTPGTSWVEELVGSFATLLEQIRGIFDQIQHFYPANDTLNTPRVRFVADIALQDARDMVYQAVTFSSQVSYEQAAASLESAPDLTFLFVGREAGAASGTASATPRPVPGTGSTLAGFGSPTASSYAPLESWSPAHPWTLVGVPAGVRILAAGAGVVTGVNLSPTTGAWGRCVEVTSTVKEGELRLLYGNLEEISLSTGSRVDRGSLIGTCAPGGLRFAAWLEGESLDPMSLFYQPAFSGGVPFGDLLGPDGRAQPEKIARLERELAQAIDWRRGVLDYWHTSPAQGGINSGIPGECPWYAWGRGAQYLASTGYPVASLPRSFGNGGDYYSRCAGWFARGQTPRANAWVCWAPKVPGSAYGHVAFVEAVEADGSFWYSEGYHSTSTPKVRHATRDSYRSWNYKDSYYLAGFIYLDQPLR